MTEPTCAHTPSTVTRYMAYPGTHASDDASEWCWPQSPWARFAQSYGLEQAVAVPWSRDLDGVFWEGPRRYADWIAGGHLAMALGKTLPYEDRRGLAHSYGLYVAIVAAALGLEIPVLVSVGSPIRADMAEWVKRARPNIGYWLHIYDRRHDWIAWLGQWFDGVVSLRRAAYWTIDGQLVGADQQAAVPGVHHSRLFDTPARWGLWADQGYFDVLKMPVTAKGAETRAEQHGSA